MSPLSLLTTRQLVLGLSYSAIFPITNLIGGGIMLFGIVVTYPFMPLAWVGGMLAVSLMGSESAYLFGAFTIILLQVFLCMVIWSTLKARGKKIEKT